MDKRLASLFEGEVDKDPMEEGERGTEKRFKPGQIVPQSGLYLNEKTGTQVTCVRGKKFPPGPKQTTYILSDATRHKGD